MQLTNVEQIKKKKTHLSKQREVISAFLVNNCKTEKFWADLWGLTYVVLYK